MSDTTATTHLTSTIESLSQGLSHAKAGATRSLHSWAETLNASKAPTLHALAKELEQLDKLLSGDNATGPAVQKALASIGQHTTADRSQCRRRHGRQNQAARQAADRGRRQLEVGLRGTETRPSLRAERRPCSSAGLPG